MAKSGAQPNNNNAGKNRPWSEEIRKAALMGDRKRLRKIAERLLDKCEEGDIAALKEFGDRFEGKVPQGIEANHTGSIVLKVDNSDVDL